MSEKLGEPWYAIRVVISHPSRVKAGDGNLYEERVTIWRTGSLAKAYELAEEEARVYAEEAGAVFVCCTDSFHLFDEKVGEGSEVWSMMRGSHLDARTYVNTFTCTERDRCSDFDPEER